MDLCLICKTEWKLLDNSENTSLYLIPPSYLNTVSIIKLYGICLIIFPIFAWENLKTSKKGEKYKECADFCLLQR